MSIEYKKSRFNYVKFRGNCYLIYNTLYNSLSRMSPSEFESYNSLCFESDEFEKLLIKQGFIVHKDVDELEQYILYSKILYKKINTKPSITVTPTMKCNARCFYCYEEGVRCGSMSEESAMKIVRAIKTMDCSNGVNLTWFGGEPLMNQGWMDLFSDCLTQEGIDFNAFLITNGSMIDENNISKMSDKWHINSVQITFDGDAEEYFRRKNYFDQEETVYYKMLRKLKLLSKAGISVQIRLNIDRNNVDSIIEAVKDLKYLYVNDEKITCYPAFLTGSDEPLAKEEKIDIIKKIIEIADGKVPVNNYLYKIPKIVACYYSQKNAFSIDTNGDVFDCEHMLGHKDFTLDNIDNSNIDLSRIKKNVGELRNDCKKCIFLPKCYGGCYDAYKNGEDPCFIDRYIIQAYLDQI